MTRSDKERMLAGEPTLSGDPELLEIAARACFAFNQAHPDDETRMDHLRPIFGEMGENVWIEAPLYVDFGELTKIGDKVFINTNCTILDGGGVTIGDQVLIAPNVQIMAAGHPIKASDRMVYPFENEPERMNFVNLAGPIKIGNGCWIGAGAIILPNVTIGDRAVIGAGAVVTKDVPADSLAVGNPARVVRQI
ncbi:sugar O-acetyltransferase [Maritalea mediterranea]|uniref:Sugar O-acetyltransferase n=1 Tax=Maritalea mediterranea TaxID=2909667 RepID=A0ABS9EB56_9HYPH|nr:sugar O-acetyltransferase [Maritalea mediterranea]MCF4099414.1 sugar O-acetyltransferase [Maritalea mediterranea]